MKNRTEMFFMTNLFKLYYWPVLASVWFVASVIITYIISISNKHVYPFFPFISDTGARPPESCIFSFMFNVEAVLLGITLYVRHHYIKLAIVNKKNSPLPRWNKLSAPLGTIGCLGIGIVGSFQEIHVMGAHSLGAFMAFGIGLVYFVVQARISYEFRNYDAPFRLEPSVIYCRIMMVGISVPLFLAATICSTIAWEQYKGDHIEYWTREDGAFAVRLSATFSEWIAALLMMGFVFSLSFEFRKLKLKEIKFEIQV